MSFEFTKKIFDRDSILFIGLFGFSLFLEPFSKTIIKKIRPKKLNFIVGCGRSGTTFLNSLLSHSDNITSFHESFGDRIACIYSYNNPILFEKYLKGYRSLLILLRMNRQKNKYYCEFNSYLRYCTDFLDAYYKPRIFHLVRDGRNVTRSMMNRNTYKSIDHFHSGKITPKKDDDHFEFWKKMNRFQKICWYWDNSNKLLLSKKLPLIKFEKLITSYDYFDSKINQIIKSRISYKIWNEKVNLPINISWSNEFPKYEKWSGKQKKDFISICGHTMNRLGYI